MSLDHDLGKQSYEIKDELKIRKVLEKHTDWQFEFTKNDKFDYDLRITEWNDEPEGPSDNRILGYVELERSRRDKECSWITGDIPDSWYFYSFLERKVLNYDRVMQTWDGLKEHYNRTVYLKFNHALDNCFAAPITAIYRDGTRTKRSDGTRTNTYRKLRFGHPEVAVGIQDSIELIESHLSQTTPEQETLLRF